MNAHQDIDRLRPAPAWQVSRWFNAPADFGLSQLHGRVVALHTFQMLCPGCVSHGLPQAKRLRATFSPEDVAVVGLHTVFEHHAVMNEAALEVFLHEYRIEFPVGVDRPAPTGSTPLTMAAYGLRGTPSLVLFDRGGNVVSSLFGALEDMSLGAAVASLVEQSADGPRVPPPSGEATRTARCAVPADDDADSGLSTRASAET